MTWTEEEPMKTLFESSVILVLLLGVSSCQVLKIERVEGPGPRSGDIYKEFRAVTGGWPHWAIIDPQAKHKRAHDYLPNSVFHVSIDDLADAVKAEVLIDRWGGHVGTVGKKIRFNGKEWIDLPELTTTPSGHDSVCYMSQDNPVLEIPLSYLNEGSNTFEGLCGDQICHSFGWGEWGLYGIIIRVYYRPGKPHPHGEIVFPRSGATLQENPTVKAEVKSKSGIEQVDFLAYYEGYDESGDGIYQDWHCFYHRESDTEPIIPISGHLGTARKSPYVVTWNTDWVPDQKPGSIRMLARIKDENGYWHVTDAVRELSLQRQAYSVKMYKPQNVPESFQVRVKRIKSCDIVIPEADDLSRAEMAAVHFRSWNGDDNNPLIDGNEWFKFNQCQGKIAGRDHNYAYTVREVPLSCLRNGKTEISIYSEAGTVYDKDGNLHNTHSIEVLWPGPALTVRYRSD